MSICNDSCCSKPHDMARELAVEKLREKNPGEVARAADAKLTDDGKIELTYIGRPCVVDLSCGHVTPVGYEREFAVKEEIIILHYLETASGRALTGNKISYRELRGSGANAISSGKDFSMDAMERAIGNSPEKLYGAIDAVCGVKAGLGDASITVSALPRVPITYVIWEGEDNIIPPAVNLLFDSTASDYLPSEDLGELSNFIAEMILSACSKQRG